MGWGSDGEGPAEETRPFQDMIAREFPGFDPIRGAGQGWLSAAARAAAGNGFLGSYLLGPKGPFHQRRSMLIFELVARGVSRRQLSSGGFI